MGAGLRICLSFYSFLGCSLAFFFSPIVRVHNILSSDIGFWVNPFSLYFLCWNCQPNLSIINIFPFVVFTYLQFSAYSPHLGDTILEDFLSVCRINMINSGVSGVCVCVCVHVRQVVKNSIKFKNASLSNFIKLKNVI